MKKIAPNNQTTKNKNKLNLKMRT